MSAQDWPEFDDISNDFMERLSERDFYNYAKARIDACAGIANELLEAGAAPIHLKAEIYRRERDALQQRCEELVASASAMVERWDSPLWADLPHTAEYINALRKAIAKQVQPCNPPPTGAGEL